ncbi:hypothetical protein WR25_21265 [Diploscapter pachys]|uniref:Uncharacterized protein n=1 Tax=Diploscapter pachys TaxID=2018661 RepID=A0A2A2JD57_9BILA|nr:hypothetical protein WR25_21265 [Diploscapter pachys]
MTETNAPQQNAGHTVINFTDDEKDLVKCLLLVILIAIFPPAAVAVQANECNVHVCVSLFLYLCFIIPSYIHAIWFCFFRRPTHMIVSTQ